MSDVSVMSGMSKELQRLFTDVVKYFFVQKLIKKLKYNLPVIAKSKVINHCSMIGINVYVVF